MLLIYSVYIEQRHRYGQASACPLSTHSNRDVEIIFPAVAWCDRVICLNLWLVCHLKAPVRNSIVVVEQYCAHFIQFFKQNTRNYTGSITNVLNSHV